ncbi:MAG TPA: glycosyltransferase [Candidatus Bipolaricaulota bacterium]
MTNVLVCGGGSGGHVYPALALLQALGAHPSVKQVGFVGTRRPLERRLFQGRGDPGRGNQGCDEIAHFSIQTGHFRGGPWHNLTSAVACGVGLFQSLRILQRFKPGVILGTGGYSSVPVLAAGLAMGIPTMTFEPNALMGLANRVLAPYVDRLFYSDPSAVEEIGMENAVQSGVPLRQQLWQTQRHPALYRRWGLDPGRKTLLALGGSLGAQALQRLAVSVGRALGDDCQILISLGLNHQELLPSMKALAAGCPRLHVVPYIDRMDEALALADAAVCRAGAVTLAELSACGVPALVVPWEGAADAHQLHNAMRFAQSGAGMVLRESELNTDAALEALTRLLAPGQLSSMHCISFAFGSLHRKACARILKEVEPYLDGKVSFYRHWRRRHERLGQGVLAATPPAARVQH